MGAPTPDLENDGLECTTAAPEGASGEQTGNGSARPRLSGQMAHVNALRAVGRVDRRARAWDLRLKGFTIPEIAMDLKVSVGAAADYLRATLDELRSAARENADSWRRIELARLDGLIAVWVPIALDTSHPEAARGAAIVIRAIEAQSRLLGLLQLNPMQQEAPPGPSTKPRPATPATIEAMERRLARARREVAAGETPAG